MKKVKNALMRPRDEESWHYNPWVALAVAIVIAGLVVGGFLVFVH